jgi:Kdo2-lipid IVA lauroyltransferase/acyltransferase
VRVSVTAPTLRHRLEYAAYRGFVGLGGVLGERAADLFGEALGGLGYWPVRFRRRIVEEQLRHAFPDADADWIRRTARAAYGHLGREALAMLRVSRLSRAQVIARTELEGAGYERVRALLAAGRGVVIATGHLGNWEVAGAAVTARGLPLDVVVQRQSNPLFDRAITKTRERMGMRVIDRRHAPRLAPRALREGRAVAFVADQNAGRSGVFVDFFGRPAATHRGPALMALRTGAPLFVAAALREGARYRIVYSEIEVSRQGEVEEVVRRLTAAFTAELERLVRTAPGQYFWVHKRWKTRPPEEQAAGPAV